MPICVRVVTQDGLLYEESAAEMVIIPGSEGEIGVLPHHPPMLTTLGYGELRIKKQDCEDGFIVYGGIAEVRPGHVIVLADMAAPSYAADVLEAEKARLRAQNLLQVGVPDECRPTVLDELHRAELMLRVAKKLPASRKLRIQQLDEDAQEAAENAPDPG